jgi:hypothetical protein
MVMEPTPGKVKGDERLSYGSVIVRLMLSLWKVEVSGCCCCITCLFLEFGGAAAGDAGKGKFSVKRSKLARKLKEGGLGGTDRGR